MWKCGNLGRSGGLVNFHIFKFPKFPIPNFKCYTRQIAPCANLPADPCNPAPSRPRIRSHRGGRCRSRRRRPAATPSPACIAERRGRGVVRAGDDRRDRALPVGPPARSGCGPLPSSTRSWRRSWSRGAPSSPAICSGFPRSRVVDATVVGIRRNRTASRDSPHRGDRRVVRAEIADVRPQDRSLGEVLDEASAELKSLRDRLRKQRARLAHASSPTCAARTRQNTCSSRSSQTENGR